MFKPIHTQSDYEAALAEVSALVDADPAKGSADGDRLEILATLLQSYERELVDMSLPAPVNPVIRVMPLPKILAEFSRDLEVALAVQGLYPKRDVGRRHSAFIKQMVELNEKTATARVVAQQRAMALLVEKVQLQVERANGQGRFKTRQSVRRALKKPIKVAPIYFKHAA